MRKLLIAEDDHFLGNAYRVKLSKEGFDIQVAVDGEDALAKLKTFVPDLILLDLMMPKKDGFSVLSDIKANPALKNIPVIVASNLGQKEDIDKAKQLGAIDFIVKSDISMGDMVKKITSHLPATPA